MQGNAHIIHVQFRHEFREMGMSSVRSWSVSITPESPLHARPSQLLTPAGNRCSRIYHHRLILPPGPECDLLQTGAHIPYFQPMTQPAWCWAMQFCQGIQVQSQVSLSQKSFLGAQLLQGHRIFLTPYAWTFLIVTNFT